MVIKAVMYLECVGYVHKQLGFGIEIRNKIWI